MIMLLKQICIITVTAFVCTCICTCMSYAIHYPPVPKTTAFHPRVSRNARIRHVRTETDAAHPLSSSSYSSRTSQTASANTALSSAQRNAVDNEPVHQS